MNSIIIGKRKKNLIAITLNYPDFPLDLEKNPEAPTVETPLFGFNPPT